MVTSLTRSPPSQTSRSWSRSPCRYSRPVRAGMRLAYPALLLAAAGASHGQVRRSTSATAPNSTMAISESRIIELKASSVFQYDVADRIT